MQYPSYGVSKPFRLPDALWEKIRPLVPEPGPKKKAGRPRMSDHQAMSAIDYVLRTGIQWKALPRSLGAASTVHDRFQEWRRAGLFGRLWQEGLAFYDEAVGLDWSWQAMDGAMTKAPLGGKGTGPNPTDRAKRGTKRCLLTERRGVPVSLAVDGANRHDMKLAERTLAGVVYRLAPLPEEVTQHLALDKGFDYEEIRALCRAWGYVAHIRARGEEKRARREIRGYRPRRWVVERTHSWMNRFRRILIRWEKDVDNYEAMLHIACAWIAFSRAGTFRIGTK